MVMYDAVKRTDPDTLRDLADDWETVATVFDEANDQLYHQVFTPLHGSALQGHSIHAASQRAQRFKQHTRAAATEATALKTAIGDFADAITDVQRRMAKVETRVAEVRGMEISEHGVVTYTVPTVPNDGPASPEEAEALDDEAVAARKAEAEAYNRQIQQLVLEATNYDSDFTARLRTIAELSTDSGGDADVSFNGDPDADITRLREENLPDDLGSDPDAAASWWAGLSPAERDWYIEHHYREIGWADGIPADARHDASMISLKHDAVDGHDRGNAAHLLERIDASRADDDPANDMFLLGYSPPGPDGNPDAKAIVAFGNPDTADHTGVLVPGTLADLGRAAGVDLDRAEHMFQESSRVTGDSVSTILWLGYEAPDNLLAAANDDMSVDAGRPFARFIDGLNATHSGTNSHLTAVGHSYGSMVVGQADILTGGLNVDDMVLVGSPGLGPEIDDTPWIDGDVDGVEDMFMDPKHIWGMSAPGDPIATEIHGDDPSAGDFGGQTLAADNNFNHDGYWIDGGSALRNQALVITGQYDEVTHAPDLPKILGMPFYPAA